MAIGMPILCLNNDIEMFNQRIDYRYNLMAVWDCEGTSGAKIILYIDNQQSFHIFFNQSEI
jgi:hypothetical protein